MTDDEHPADALDGAGLGDGPAWLLDEAADVTDGVRDATGVAADSSLETSRVDDDGDAAPDPELFDGPAEFDVEDVERFLSDAPDGDALRPALPTLTDDQRDLIREFVDGFASRGAFLEWCQDAAIRTLGELDGDWMQTRAFTRLDLSVLITSEARRRFAPESGDVLSKRQAAGVRRGVVLSDILPACTAAYRRLRWNATEYVNDGDDSFVPDPEVQEHTAMRPALTELDDRQDWAIRKLLTGISSEDALLSWLQVVTEASYAEVDSGLGERLNVERRARRLLLDDVEPDEADLARWFRESFAAKYVLPGFAVAASEVGKRAGELAQQEATEFGETTL